MSEPFNRQQVADLFGEFIHKYVDLGDAESEYGPPWTSRLIVAIYRGPRHVDATLLITSGVKLKDPTVVANCSYDTSLMTAKEKPL